MSHGVSGIIMTHDHDANAFRFARFSAQRIYCHCLTDQGRTVSGGDHQTVQNPAGGRSLPLCEADLTEVTPTTTTQKPNFARQTRGFVG